MASHIRKKTYKRNGYSSSSEELEDPYGVSFLPKAPDDNHDGKIFQNDSIDPNSFVAA